MDRLACVSLAHFPLQLLRRRHPEWKDFPLAVVDRDEPQGTLLFVDERARRAGLRPGLRFAGALSLERNLRAAVVAEDAVAEASAAVARALGALTPHVERDATTPGIFHLDARGLGLLYSGVRSWARAVAAAVDAEGYRGRVVVGFARFATQVLARARLRGNATEILCLADPDDERRRLRQSPLSHLGATPELLAKLSRLGLRRVGDFLDLEPSALRRRFGDEAWRLHRRAREHAWQAPQPERGEGTWTASLVLDEALSDTELLLFVLRRLLRPLLVSLAEREKAALAVHAVLRTGLRADAPVTALSVACAEATLDEAVLADLLRLRLERVRLARAVVEIELEVVAAPADRSQLSLFRGASPRDLGAGARALARVRAEFGDDAVARAVLRDGHLPEASFAWKPMAELRAPEPRAVRARPLVRRFRDAAVALPPRPFRERDDSWIASAAGHGRIESMTDPYVVSGGWWNREIHREYCYACTESGEILWVYFDRRRRRWFLAGSVE